MMFGKNLQPQANMRSSLMKSGGEEMKLVANRKKTQE